MGEIFRDPELLESDSAISGGFAMMRIIIRFAAFCVLVLALALVAAVGPASAEGPPTVKPLDAVCTAAGGLFFGEFFPETRAVCDSNINAGIALSEQFVDAARNLCLNAYKADFFVVSGPPGWPTWNCGFF